MYRLCGRIRGVRHKHFRAGEFFGHFHRDELVTLLASAPATNAMRAGDDLPREDNTAPGVAGRAFHLEGGELRLAWHLVRLLCGLGWGIEDGEQGREAAGAMFTRPVNQRVILHRHQFAVLRFLQISRAPIPLGLP